MATPPLPPPSPPPPPPSGTTIGKYIARFRHESPRPRDARRTARREDFWWLESRRETASPSPQAESEASMEWELELLSSASSASSRVRASAELDGVPSSLASSRASAASPTAPDTTVVDDGFVLLPSDALEDDKSMLDASLEDPEMVIQRVRRRLGFQPTALGSAPVDQQRFSPAFSHDGLEEDMQHGLSMPTLSDSLYDGEEHCMASLRLDLSASLEDDSMVLDSLRSSAVSLDVALTGAEEDVPTEDKAPAQEAQPLPIGADATEASVLQHQNSGPDASKHGGAGDVGDILEEPSDAVVPQQEMPVSPLPPTQQDALATDTEQKDSEAPDSNSNSPRNEPIPTKQTDTTKQNDGKETDSNSSSPRNEPIQTDSGKTSPVPSESEKRASPRLPPLSPMRGPLYRPAPLTPRPLDITATEPPEVTAETSKTLDSLLSLVVHSWGENSLFGGSDDSESETAKTSPTQKAPEAFSLEDTKEEKKEEKEEELKTTPANEPTEDDLSEFAGDPVVTMLRDRIAVLETALERLDEK